MTTLTFTPQSYDSFTEFTIEVDPTDAERVKRLLTVALSDYSSASSKRRMESEHRNRVDAQRERNHERNRLRHALKRAGIEVRSQDEWRSYKADLQASKSYSTDTTNGWLRLSQGSSYPLLNMVAKLGKQSEVEWELRREKHPYSDDLTDVLYVRMPETAKANKS